HPDREQPRENDDGEDDDQRRHHERPIGGPTQWLVRRGVLRRGRRRLCYHAHAFSLRSRIGRNCSCAFFSSVAGSAPDKVAVSAAPTMSRNSATGTITGRPSFEILAEPITESSHSGGIFTPLRTVSSLSTELRNGTPP